MPADAGVDDGRSGILDTLGQLHHLFPGGAALDEVEHAQAVHDDEVRPERLAGAAYDLNRQPDAVLVRAAPLVGALVGLFGDELVDQVPFATHDLDTVIAGLGSELGAAHKVVDGALDADRVQRLGLEHADGRLDGRRRHGPVVVGVAAGVQDLHCNLAAFAVGRLGDHAVVLGLAGLVHLGRQVLDAAGVVGRDAAGHAQADLAAGALGKVLGHVLEASVGQHLLQPRVHGAHQHAVAQHHAPAIQLQRPKQLRESRGRHRPRPAPTRGPRR
mmetsp:Transcript_26679/g.84898  ORF Transcript_26679/g.84898 Transcript_26679/m.84898 type:complete len:273 (-) Transcript_26679:17-835(-)